MAKRDPIYQTKHIVVIKEREVDLAQQQDSRVSQWTPPARPDWVARVNDEGKHLDIAGIVPLDPDSLIATAIRNSGLSDFGSEDWRAPFEALVRSIDTEGDLTLMGRILTRSDLLMNLEGRLSVEDTYKRHPEIENEVIKSPLIIIGSGRSGTSILQNLLMNDTDNGVPRHWEALFPSPPPEAATFDTDPRIAKAHNRMTMWDRISPPMRAIHEWDGHLPTELIHIETMAFQNSGFLDMYGYCPSFHAFMDGKSMVPSLEYSKRVLKLLQWKNPKKRWVLKDPDALRYLPDLLTAFPDAKLVWIHRDPLKSLASGVNLVGTLFALRSDRPLSPDFITKVTDPDHMAQLFELVMDYMDDGTIKPSNLVHLQYLDFIRDPVAVIARLYDDLGLALPDAARDAMANYMAENRKQKREKHVYDEGDPERRNAERKLFANYQARFGIENEM